MANKYNVNQFVALAQAFVDELKKAGLDGVEVAGVVSMAGSILVQRHSDRAGAMDALGKAVAEGVTILDDLEAASPVRDLLAEILKSDGAPGPTGLNEVDEADLDAFIHWLFKP